MPKKEVPLPSKIEQKDRRTLSIVWADGVETLIDVRALRLACGCANCVDEWSGDALLTPDSVPSDIAPVGIQSVGRYAIQIDWSDGHNTGIYPFERLRKLADDGLLDARAPETNEITDGTP
jgi:ATP-binding protein involved in chromosome partitioning